MIKNITLLCAFLYVPQTFSALPPSARNLCDLDVMYEFVVKHRKVAQNLKLIDLENKSIHFGEDCKVFFERYTVMDLLRLYGMRRIYYLVICILFSATCYAGDSDMYNLNYVPDYLLYGKTAKQLAIIAKDRHDNKIEKEPCKDRTNQGICSYMFKINGALYDIVTTKGVVTGVRVEKNQNIRANCFTFLDVDSNNKINKSKEKPTVICFSKRQYVQNADKFISYNLSILFK